MKAGYETIQTLPYLGSATLEGPYLAAGPIMLHIHN